ncbi:antibiotic biosynthesis monooxygenase [Corynebacterium poyangense]|uniref:Antibiotic biosynthesis monooxygenase n=1 Tax=Corynebacterium poyangense TaxID=2684405 RepID=A0A7H0SS13_9CORY|nr:antibiotic biosynthesis monooxygenase [Corynebacterium poyangense]QNQ91338.1 antibiotic biosynthesis monooxygenase [Corynebacterium poyangense]
MILTGYLRCKNSDETELILKYLPGHIIASRQEPGCLKFIVRELSDGLTWEVSEQFVDQKSFKKHQERTKNSEWGRKTAHILRDYTMYEK